MARYEDKVADYNCIQVAIAEAARLLERSDPPYLEIWQDFKSQTALAEQKQFKAAVAAVDELIRQKRVPTAKVMRRLILGCEIPKPVKPEKRIR